MKAEDFEKLILDYVQAPKNAPQLSDFMVGVAQAAHAILEVHEADLALAQDETDGLDGLLDGADTVIADLKEDVATAQAQVTELYCALDTWVRFRERSAEEDLTDEQWSSLVSVCRKALSAAPKVLHSEEAKWDTEWLVWPVVRLQRPPAPFCRGPDDVMPGVTFMGHDPKRYEEFPGKEAHVIVLGKQGKGE